jgi:hypothetical protein
VVRAALLVLAGCGRFGFDAAPAGDAQLGDGLADGAACSAITSVDWLATPMPLDVNKQYTVSDDGLTVFDGRTNLRWERNVLPGTFTPLQALAHCASLTLNGCAHWRMPERVELATIVDHQFLSPTIDPAAFPSTPVDTHYWTGTPPTSANNFWEINFDNGNAAWNADSLAYHVRCVHSETTGTPPPARYTVSANAVYDNQTGLTWTRAKSSPAPLATAISYCNTLGTDGGGWRLPEVQELETIIDSARLSPALDPSAFPAVAGEVWTNSPYSMTFSMLMKLDDGSTINADNTSSFSALCVH